jgi:hypothetical protein
MNPVKNLAKLLGLETLADCHKLGNLCKGLVMNPCRSRRKCLRAFQTRASRKTQVVGKVYNLYRVKTDISAVLTVKNGLDPPSPYN